MFMNSGADLAPILRPRRTPELNIGQEKPNDLSNFGASSLIKTKLKENDFRGYNL